MFAHRNHVTVSLPVAAMALLSGCASDGPVGPGGNAVPGVLIVESATNGVPGVPVGLSVVVEGGTHEIDFNDELTLSADPGRYSVELRGVPARCSLAGESARAIDVPADSFVTVTFQIDCPCLTDLDERILFSRSDVDNYRYEGIYAIHPTTRERLFLTGDGADHRAVASPRGDAFAYVEVTSCGFLCSEVTVRIVNSCGRRIGAVDAAVGPHWSSDGEYLAVTLPGTSTVKVVRPDGSRVAERSGAVGDWSPDGTRVAYTAPNGDVWTMKFDGTDAVNLTNSGESRWYLRWSPDGTKIAFTVRAPDNVDGLGDIYTVTADGSAVDCLRCDAADEGDAVWSPDGSKLAFRRAGEGIMVSGPDGADPLLVASPLLDGHFWSPDGSRLAFTCLHNTTGNVCVVNADGSGQTFLTQDSGFDAVSAWGPN